VLAGLLTGTVILVFRGIIDYTLGTWLLPDGSESFELLERSQQVAMPLIGALLLAAALARIKPRNLRVGVMHVMERLSRHQGRLPLRNALVQFAGGIVALTSGFSGGREGPAVHLGAASSSLLGQAFELPNNSIRTLVACGTAAAIAGSFNTPLAGVIFAMEVVMMDYTITSFIPVIISAVSATVLTRYFIGSDAAFLVAPAQLESLAELPFIALAGIAIGGVATAFIMTVQLFARLTDWPFWVRVLFAGAINAIAALAVPEVMGVGYDTVNGAMLGEIGLATLLLLIVFKLTSSAAAVGLGVPVGIIGPTFVIGAGIGGVLGILGDALQPGQASSIGLYVMLGMAGMMAATLQAPLASLIAVLELTANPNVILPAMLVIVVATMTTSVAFRQQSVFLSMLRTLGLEYPPDPTTLHLHRAGVSAVMSRAVVRLPLRCSPEQAREALVHHPSWVAVEGERGEIRCILKASDLDTYLQSSDGSGTGTEKHVPSEDETTGPGGEIRLLSIPGLRMDTASIDHKATLAEARARLQNSGVEALCVRRQRAPMIRSVVGVITQADIDNYRDATP
jgi:CIC family chloride channel protein